MFVVVLTFAPVFRLIPGFFFQDQCFELLYIFSNLEILVFFVFGAQSMCLVAIICSYYLLLFVCVFTCPF